MGCGSHPSVSRQGIRRATGALAVGFALAACTEVRSNVEVFHEMPADYAGATITILASAEEKAKTLEFRNYAERLAGKLEGVGFQVVGEGELPRYVAFLAYDVGEGQQVTRTYSIPNYGVTGYSSSHTYGTLNTYGGVGTYSGTTTHTPQYGITGYSTGTTTTTLYPRVLIVDIYEVDWSDTEKSPQVYHLSIASSGRCGRLSQVIDEMLEAGFQDFPGESGTVQRIEVPAKVDC